VGIKPNQPTQTLNDRNLAGVADLKIRYVEPLRDRVIEPLRQDLARLQAQLRSELSRPDLETTAKAALELEIQTIERTFRVLDQEFERAKSLRLSDYDVPVDAVAEAAGLTAR
jgi:hypothetical protein